jgi:hypothetical protein
MSHLRLCGVSVSWLKLTETKALPSPRNTDRNMGCNGRLADFLAETAEQPIAVPQPLAYYIGYRVRKTVNVCIGYRRQLPKFFYTIPTHANNVIFYQVISMDYTNPKMFWSG